MPKIAPSLFDLAEEELEDAVEAAANADYFHIDITDGRFVKDKKGGASLFYDEEKLEKVKTEVLLDIHLMVDDPRIHIARYATFHPKYISFHVEATDDPGRVIDEIGFYDVSPVVALNPHTHLAEIVPFLGMIDMVLLMSVVPGKGGQGYIHDVTEKIVELKHIIDGRGYDVKIEVDGGIKLYNAHRPARAGADILVSGTGVFNYGPYSPGQMVGEMASILDKRMEPVVLASDHAGYGLKEFLKEDMLRNGIRYEDLGCHSEESVDYPDYAEKLAEAVSSGSFERGVLICGTGIGMSMKANRHPGIRAALCNDAYTAAMAAQHNEANILCLGGRVISNEQALSVFDAWYYTKFEERHRRRVEMLG